MTYVGGFSFSASDPRVSGISAIRTTDHGTRFLAVTDNGDWLIGRIKRDKHGQPIGIADASLLALRNRVGQIVFGKAMGDAESLAVDEVTRRAYVGFEELHRIWAYHVDALATSKARLVDVPIPVQKIPANKGMEALMKAPADSFLHGALVTVTERALDKDGNVFAAILGKGGGVFKVRHDPRWDVTDGDFLPNGDLLLLERRFEGVFGLGARIRLIEGRSIKPGAVVDGPVVFEADLSEEIDNMEGLDVWPDRSGRLHVTLVSDNNGSVLQRNLMLEFLWTKADPLRVRRAP
nr:esterase-like activity of phytase family protein [Jiella flava]